MTGGLDQKATSKYVQVNRPAAAFSGDNNIALASGGRIAVRVNTGKHEASAAVLVAKPHNHIDETYTIRIIADDLLCNAPLVLEFPDPGISLLLMIVEVGQSRSGR